MTDTKLLTSPEADVLFSALKNARTNKHSGKTEYSVRVYVTGKTPGAAEFMKALKKINKGLVVTEDAEGNSIVKADGDFIINAKAKDRPRIFQDGTSLTAEETPMIESGTVRIVVSSFEGKEGKGGGINLQAVELIDIKEYQGSEPLDTDLLKEALKASNSK